MLCYVFLLIINIRAGVTWRNVVTPLKNWIWCWNQRFRPKSPNHVWSNSKWHGRVPRIILEWQLFRGINNTSLLAVSETNNFDVFCLVGRGGFGELGGGGAKMSKIILMRFKKAPTLRNSLYKVATLLQPEQLSHTQW